MSEEVGYQYKSRISTLSDNASILEALKVYHYGVDDWTTEPIPDDSIEGNFRSVNEDITTLQAEVDALGGSWVAQISLTATPNIITGESTATVPLTLRAIASQTVALQQWQNSSSVSVGSVSAGGSINLAGYATIGSTTQASTVGVNVVLGSAAHKGIVVKAQASQTANLQEWQNSSSSAMTWVTADGSIFIQGEEVIPAAVDIGSFFLMGA